MTTGAVVFWLLSWGCVLSLMIWAYSRILGAKKHFDPDGIGPASPPETGKFDKEGNRIR